MIITLYQSIFASPLFVKLSNITFLHVSPFVYADHILESGQNYETRGFTLEFDSKIHL